jgi:hypothetical protein
LRAFDTDFFTRLGELSIILSKILAGNFHEEAPSYAQKISVRSSREVKAERTTLERSRKKRVQKKKL